MDTQIDDNIAPFGVDSQYFWSPSSATQLSEFLAKCRPSMVQDDGTKPWIWVLRSNFAPEENRKTAMEEAATLLTEVTAKLDEINTDPSIPVRSSKKTDAKSKKEVREQVQLDATNKLKEISVEHGCISGKWLVFSGADKVDAVWKSLAESIVAGPLSTTPVHAAKVSTSPKTDTPNYRHVICLYMPNVYDKDAVTQTMKVLLRNHGAVLSGVKSNLYTEIGLDSKHPSGVPPTIWKNSSVLPEPEMKELRDAYFAEVQAKASALSTASPTKTDSNPERAAEQTSKPKLKKRKVDDDPFATDEEGDHAESSTQTKRTADQLAKPKPSTSASAAIGTKRAKGDATSDTESDTAEENRKKRRKENE